MDISSLSSANLRSIIGLVDKRDKLVAEVAAIESQITKALSDGYFPWGGAAAPAKGKRGRKPKAHPDATPAPAAPKTKKARKGRRGGLKDKVIAELEAAGKSGAAVKDIAAKLGVKPQNVHVWFATTGKKFSKKISPGVYALA